MLNAIHSFRSRIARAQQERQRERNLIALGAALHAEAVIARERVQSMPDALPLEREQEILEQIAQPGDRIAHQIMAIWPTTQRGADVRMRAEIWLDGRYSRYYLRFEK